VPKDQQVFPGAPGIPSGSGGLTEESTRILAESIINTLPLAIWPKLPPIKEEQINAFNRELYLYCQRKGINPMDYLFDEFGLVVCGLGIASVHYSNYQEFYGKGKKSKPEDPGTAAYDHATEIANAIKEKEIVPGNA
jgi:hypothetical protein